jgi:hypothetical protein
VTMSPPIRVFAFVGVVAIVGLALFAFVVGRGAGDSTTAPTARVGATPQGTTEPKTTAPTFRAQKPRAAALPASGFPLPVRRALRRHPVVVVVVYTPQASVDSVVRREARAGARAGRAGLVQVSAFSERLMRPLVAKTGVLPNPSVLVVRRPGVVTATLGVTDRATIIQAVTQARR